MQGYIAKSLYILNTNIIFIFIFYSKSYLFFFFLSISSSKTTKISQENMFFFKKQTFNIFDDQRKVAHESVLSVWEKMDAYHRLLEHV